MQISLNRKIILASLLCFMPLTALADSLNQDIDAYAQIMLKQAIKKQAEEYINSTNQPLDSERYNQSNNGENSIKKDGDSDDFIKKNHDGSVIDGISYSDDTGMYAKVNLKQGEINTPDANNSSHYAQNMTSGVYDVQKGSLYNAIRNLVCVGGNWHIIWLKDNMDYSIPYNYTISGKSMLDILSKIVKPYPIKVNIYTENHVLEFVHDDSAAME